MLRKEEEFDNQKRNKYGQKWRRPPSNIVQKSCRDQIDLYEQKAKQADQVNGKLIVKY